MKTWRAVWEEVEERGIDQWWETDGLGVAHGPFRAQPEDD